MTVEESIAVFMTLQKRIFRKPAAIIFPFDMRGRLKSRYSNEDFENEIKKIIASRGLDTNLVLQEANLRSAVTYEILMSFSIGTAK